MDTQSFQTCNEIGGGLIDINMDIDFVILAVGSSTDNQLINQLGLETNKWGYIQVDENYKTSDKKIYAIGDLAGNKQTVAWAARSGVECAKIIVNK